MRFCSASCGRCSLYSRSNLRNTSCCCRKFAAGGFAVSCFSVWCIRSCRPFCSGQPGSIRSWRIPSPSHHIARRLNPAGAGLANGGPLSLRIASGKPYSRNTASNTARTWGPSVFSTDRQRCTYRLKASLMVSGSHRSPLPHKNQPLKSVHQTWLGAPACARGWLYNGVCRRLRRGTLSPPMLLAAGHRLPGSRPAR